MPPNAAFSTLPQWKRPSGQADVWPETRATALSGFELHSTYNKEQGCAKRPHVPDGIRAMKQAMKRLHTLSALWRQMQENTVSKLHRLKQYTDKCRVWLPYTTNGSPLPPPMGCIYEDAERTRWLIKWQKSINQSVSQKRDNKKTENFQ